MTQYKVRLPDIRSCYIEPQTVLCKPGDRVKYHAIGSAGSGADTPTSTGEIVDIVAETQPVGSTGVTAKVRFASPFFY